MVYGWCDLINIQKVYTTRWCITFAQKWKGYKLITVQFSILHIMWINLGHIGRYAEQKHCDLWFAGVVSVACSKPNKHPIYTTFYTQI